MSCDFQLWNSVRDHRSFAADNWSASRRHSKLCGRRETTAACNRLHTSGNHSRTPAPMSGALAFQTKHPPPVRLLTTCRRPKGEIHETLPETARSVVFL